jgi:lysophospholipase L1-like esterase
VLNGPSLSLNQFSDVNDPAATFTPVAIAGTYILTWSVSNSPCVLSTSNVAIQFTNISPVARAGNDTSIILPSNSLLLNASASSDADGTISSYQWSLISGPGAYQIASPLAVSTSVQNLVEGLYSFQLKVTDNFGFTGYDTVVVKVASRILIDIGSYSSTGSPDANGNYWNNMVSGIPGVRVQNAVTSANVPTTLKIEVINRIDGTYEAGSNGLGSNTSTGTGTVGAVGDYPATATDDYAYAHTSTEVGSWKFTGLDSATEYRIKFWGARLLTNRSIEIKRSDETNWQTYDAGNNRDYNRAAYFSFSGKKEISFDIRVKQGSLFGIISVMDIIKATTLQNNITPPSNDSDRVYCGLPYKIVVLGSSTAYGTGAIPGENSWVNKFTDYVKRKNPANVVYNLALPGYTTYHSLCPDGFVPPSGRPNPSAGYNISEAIRLGAHAVIVNLPSNDIAANYTLQEQQANFERVAAIARQNNIALWVSTSQPRNDISNAQSEQLKLLRDWINNRFGNMSVDFWTGIANPDATINEVYNFDNIHLNNEGHDVLYRRVLSERILDSICVIQSRRPVAEAGNDTTVYLSTGSLVLNGTRSSVYDGTITSYRWSGVSGATGYLLSAPDSARTTLSNLSEGVYVLRLQVTDNYGRTADDSITVKVASRILVDVGSQSLTFSPDANGFYWNNMASGVPGIQVQNAITTLNSSTAIKLEVLNRIDGTYEPGSTGLGSNSANGAGTVGPVGDYPASATDDYAYAHTSTTNGSWKFTGLDSAAEYRIKFWGSRLLTNRSIEIKRSDESEWKTYDAANNRDSGRAAYFNFSGKRELSFDIRVKEGSLFGVISVLDIARVGPGSSVVNPSSGDSDQVYCGSPYKIVVLGSSTAYGNGADPIENSWVNKYRAYIKRKNPLSEVYNLGIPGFTTYQVLCPDGLVPPSGRPDPVSGYNISEALRLGADAIIINLPSNDAANNYALEEQQANFERVADIARQNNVALWVTTSQPRTDLSSTQRGDLQIFRDWILSRFGNRAIDFWSLLGNADGTILQAYNYDNIHLNNAGHDTLYRRVLREMVLDSLCIAQNRLPTAQAGSDTAIYLPASSLVLDGSRSFEYGATITGYQWSYVSGPAGSILASSDNSTTLLSNLTEGVYIFRLQVTDNFGKTGADSITIRVAAGRILIDIGNSTLTASPDANGYYWNNMTSALTGIQVQNAVTSNNESTTLTLEVVNRIDGTYGLTADPLFTNTPLGVVGPVGDYPASATDDYTFSHTSATEGRWKIGGLDPAKTYTVKFWGSRLVENRSIDIKRAGELDWQTYDAANNRDYNRAAVFTFSGQTQVDFDIRSNQASPFGIINLIDITYTNSPVQSRPYRYSTSSTSKQRNSVAEGSAEKSASVKAYPVPVRRGQELTIDCGNTMPVEMMLVDAQGVPVRKFRAARITRIPTGGIAKGVYRLWDGRKVLASIIVVE